MRLTLRTLLAYLDDILEPAQTKEIGAKISESAFAMSLATRIREVMRQRRLTAPELVDENGLDPNVTAEYLDNTLPPDDVAEVEKKCLESDVHLAEVSASHQILTLVLGEPVDIAPESRERMYALATARPTDGATTEKPVPATAAPVKAVAVVVESRTPLPVQAIGGARVVAPKPHAPQIPAYLRRTPLWRRAAPVVVIAAIAALFFWTIYKDPHLQSPPRGDSKTNVAANDAGKQDTVSADPTAKNDTKDRGDDTTVAETDKGSVDPADVAINGARSASTPDNPLVPPNVATQTELPVVEPATKANAVTVPPAVAITTPPVAGAPPAPGIQPSAKQAPAVPPTVAAAAPLPAAPSILYNSPGGVLFRYDDQANAHDWYVVPHRAVIHSGERIASTEPFAAQLDVGADLFRAIMHEGTAATILPPSQAWLFGFDIRRGRISLRWAQEGAASSKQPEEIPSVGFQVDGDAWRLKLMTDDAVCGIDVVRLQPNRFELLPGPKTYTAVLFVVGGTVRVEGANGQANNVGAGNWMSLSPIVNPDGQGEVPAASIEAITRMPNWLAPDSDKVTTAARQISAMFEKEIQPTQPLNHYMPTAVASKKPRLSQLAVQALALTESVDSLVTALLQSTHEESRVAAIDGLRTWLVLSPDNGPRLRELLKAAVGNDDVELFARLIWGYSRDDAHNVATSKQLVEWMAHDNLAVRELAFYNVIRLTGRKSIEYRADLNADRRRLAVNRWLALVDQNQGLLRAE